MKIHGLNGKNYIFAVPKTQCIVRPKDSTVIQKENKLIISIGKNAESDNWFSLYKTRMVGERDEWFLKGLQLINIIMHLLIHTFHWGFSCSWRALPTNFNTLEFPGWEPLYSWSVSVLPSSLVGNTCCNPILLFGVEGPLWFPCGSFPPFLELFDWFCSFVPNASIELESQIHEDFSLRAWC